jgi:hypothetical protein
MNLHNYCCENMKSCFVYLDQTKQCSCKALSSHYSNLGKASIYPNWSSTFTIRTVIILPCGSTEFMPEVNEYRKQQVMTNSTERIIWRILTMVYKTQNYWIFGLCSLSGILNNVSEDWSVSILRWEGETLYWIQWLRLTLSKGSNRVCISFHLSKQVRSSFRNVVFSCVSESLTMDEGQKPSN